MKIVSAEKKIVDVLVDECAETVEEVKLAKIILAENENKYKCSSWTLYIVLMIVVFTICAGIGTYFVFYNWPLVKNLSSIKFNTQVKQINIKNRIYYFYNDITDLKNFEPNLLKIDKKLWKNIDIYYIGYIMIKKIDDYESISSVNSLYLRINHPSEYFKGNNVNKHLIFNFVYENKEGMFGMKLKTKWKQ